MAGDWLKMRCELQSHPKVVRILSATNSDKFRVIGGLHAVWSVFDTHSTDGTLFGYTPELMDHVIGWDGFSAAMQEVGWLLFDGVQTLTLPDFDEHNSKGAKRRAEDQKRKRDARRNEDNARNDCGQNADKKGTREREDLDLRASLSLGARASDDPDLPIVTLVDGDGRPVDSPITALTADQSAAVVQACKALRRMGAVRFSPGDERLAALVIEGFTAAQIARVVAEKALRDASLASDPDVRPDLGELVAAGAPREEWLLPPELESALRGAAAQVSIGYIAATLRGRRRDAQTSTGDGDAGNRGAGGAGGRSAVERVKAANARAEARERANAEGRRDVG